LIRIPRPVQQQIEEIMRSMKVVAAVVLGALAGVAAASAADLSPRTYSKAAAMTDPAFDWTGFYVGLNAGYGWGDPGSNFRGNPAGSFGAPLDPSSYVTRNRGFIGGAQAGYNYQTGALVLGVEADIQYADIKGTTTTPSTFLPGLGDFAHYSESQKLDWLGTLRGRLGFVPTANVLLYATGGLAYGGVRATSLYMFETPPFATYTGATTETRVGWTAGGGAEWAFDRAWSVKGEYLYYDLGTIGVTGRQPGNVVFSTITSQKVAGQFVRLGLNYRFGGPVIARY
jgi:outer membrane immunogenic protein